MDVTVNERPAHEPTIVTVSGQLDIDNAPKLRETVDELLERRVNRIVVDLSDLGFCDSIGLSTFLVAHTLCVESGGFLRLAAPTPFLLRVVTVVGLRDKLPAYRTVAQACADDPNGLLP